MPNLPNNIRITISIDFLKAFAEVPVSQQKKVREFVQLFQSNPTLPSINYETIKGACDPNLRSARIDKDYRAIIAKPKNGNVYILLWVAKHDDAYQWAMQRRLQINPMTGSLQIMEIDKIEAKVLRRVAGVCVLIYYFELAKLVDNVKIACVSESISHAYCFHFRLS